MQIGIDDGSGCRADMIASQANEGCRIGYPDPSHPIRYYRDGSYVNDKTGEEAMLADFKEVMRLEAIVAASTLPQMTMGELMEWWTVDR